jgi:DNA-binding transcriptional ArsR family regulator
MSRRGPGRTSQSRTVQGGRSSRDEIAGGRVTRGEGERQTLLGAIAEEGRRMSTRSVLMHAAIADKLGLNPSDHKCADVLRDQPGPITAGRLAELTGLTTGAITGVLDRLERAGFVSRDRDPNDRRRVVVRCTPERAPDLGPLFMPLRDGMIACCQRYTDGELRLILEFMQSSEAVMRAHMQRLTQLAPPATAALEAARAPLARSAAPRRKSSAAAKARRRAGAR